MVLISSNVEYKYQLIEQLKKSKIQTDIFTEDDLNNNFDNDDCDYVIIEYDPKKIDYFSKKGKRVIVCCFDNEKVGKSYKKKDTIFICNHIEDVIKFVPVKSFKKHSIIITKHVKKVISICIVIFTIMIALFGIHKIAFSIKKAEDNTNNKKKQQTTVQKLDVEKGKYVFLGDSITDFYDLENYYGDLPVVNSGISGNCYEDLLDNIDSRVIQYNPTKVFILIGTNDIAFTEITNEELTDKIIEICDAIKKEKKKTDIYVESIYPINNHAEDDDKIDIGMVNRRENKRIMEINKLLEEKVKKNKYYYIDMYDLLVDENGDLDINYTTDGLHISDEGYQVITKKIKDIIYDKDQEIYVA